MVRRRKIACRLKVRSLALVDLHMPTIPMDQPLHRYGSNAQPINLFDYRGE